MTDKKRILLVDDSRSMHVAARSALGDEFELVCCEDGLEAIATIVEFKPDLVFMDIMMPKLDGYETVALIRLNEMFRSLPIIMMSSKGGVFDLAHGKLLGFNGNIVKPFQAADLLQSIREHLGDEVAA
ncbi:twitching motility two-component system response regulator PilG [Roseateles asaccharophilus]|uniref:response regulator n=1 Tax=Roseateles asaccharophilus TaxID=582607 RepID=UPI003833BEA1